MEISPAELTVGLIKFQAYRSAASGRANPLKGGYMFAKHYVYFTEGKNYAGPFFTFEAAFSHVSRHKKDARIETEDGQVLATWNLWTGLYKVGAKYKYLVVDNEFNRAHYPKLVGQVLDVAPSYAMVQDVEVAA